MTQDGFCMHCGHHYPKVGPETLGSIMRDSQGVLLLQCEDCQMSWRVERVTPHTSNTFEPHCVACGSIRVIRRADHQTDRWYALAANLGFPRTIKAVELVKELYRLWEPTDHQYFQDFVKDAVAGVKGA